MIESKARPCAERQTPLAPLIRGGLKARRSPSPDKVQLQGVCQSPSLDKGRVGEGVGLDESGRR